MKDKTNKQFYFTPNYGLFLGVLNDNIVHQHYAVQLSICLEEVMELTIDQITSSKSSFFLKSNTQHQLICPETQLTILINPISRIGHYLQYLHKAEVPFQVNEKVLFPLISTLRKCQLGETQFPDLVKEVVLFFVEMETLFEKAFLVKDDRIAKAIRFLDDNFDRQVSLEEVAKICFLSPSRLIHLFKTETQTTFRRYKLWNKLVKSLPFLKNQSITATAHQFGFTDSAHYTRTFKETFGVTPKFLIPKG